jgi:hypothetical protein
MTQKLADLFNILFGFRKFIGWLAILAVGIIFRLKNYIDGPGFVDLIKATFLGFVAGNGVEHLVTVVKDYMAGQAPSGAPDAATTVAASDNVVQAD